MPGYALFSASNGQQSDALPDYESTSPAFLWSDNWKKKLYQFGIMEDHVSILFRHDSCNVAAKHWPSIAIMLGFVLFVFEKSRRIIPCRLG